MERKKAKSVRGRLAEGAPNPIDVHVGSRIKWRRKVLKISQQKMADALGLTFQQVQKYEKGMNRVGASRLWDISRILGVSMDFFFADMDPAIQIQSPMMLIHEDTNKIGFLNEAENNVDFDPMKRKETLELVSAYYKINNRKLARQLFNLIVSVSKTNVHLTDENQEE